MNESFTIKLNDEIIDISSLDNSLVDLVGITLKAKEVPEEYSKFLALRLDALLEETFTDRELKLLINVLDYSNADYQAGLPGHNLMIVISKLLGIIDITREDINNVISVNDEIPF